MSMHGSCREFGPDHPIAFPRAFLAPKGVQVTSHVVRVQAEIVSLYRKLVVCLLDLKSGILTPHVMRNDAHVVSLVKLGFLTRVLLLDNCIFERS